MILGQTEANVSNKSTSLQVKGWKSSLNRSRIGPGFGLQRCTGRRGNEISRSHGQTRKIFGPIKGRTTPGPSLGRVHPQFLGWGWAPMTQTVRNIECRGVNLLWKKLFWMVSSLKIYIFRAVKTPWKDLTWCPRSHGLVVRVVACDARGPGFNSSSDQMFLDPDMTNCMILRIHVD